MLFMGIDKRVSYIRDAPYVIKPTLGHCYDNQALAKVW